MQLKTGKRALPNSSDKTSRQPIQTKFENGQLVFGTVAFVKPSGITVKMRKNVVGIVAPLDISGDLKIVNQFTTLFKPGMYLECVVNGKTKKNSPKLSIIKAPIQFGKQYSSYPAPNRQLSDYLVGTQTLAQIKRAKFDKNLNLHVELPSQYGEEEHKPLKGFVHRLETVDDLLDIPVFYPMQIVMATVVKVEDDNTIRLSLRTKDSLASDPLIDSFQNMEVGSTAKGIIHNLKKPSIEVVFGPNVTAMVKVSPNARDDKNHIHRLKRGSMASFQLSASDPPQFRLIKVLPYHKVNNVDFDPKKVVLARIVKADNSGLKLENISTNSILFCPRFHIPKSIKDPSLHFVHGKELAVQVINPKTPESSQTVTLLPKGLMLGDYRHDTKHSSNEDESEGEQISHKNNEESETYDDEDGSVGSDEEEQEDEDEEDEKNEEDEADEDEEEDEEKEESSTTKIDLTAPVLPLDTTQDALELSDSETEAATVKPKAIVATPVQPQPKVRKRLPKDITAELDSTAPTTTTDFERLLLTSPNSSYLWIGYMAYHLQLREVDLARAVADKALKTISFHSEQERFNVHIARMNLELKFADLDSLLQYYDKAKFEVNQPKHLGLRLAEILKQNGFSTRAEETLLQLCKKSATSCKVWLALGQLYLDLGARYTAEFKATLPKAIQALPKRKHLKLTLKYATLEFKANHLERARTLFEGILATYPKRTDLIHHYVDLEIKYGAGKSGDLERIRRIFERTLNNQGVKLKPQQVKGLFKKYLSFEDTYGDEVRKDHVKSLAVDFINNLNGA